MNHRPKGWITLGCICWVFMSQGKERTNGFIYRCLKERKKQSFKKEAEALLRRHSLSLSSPVWLTFAMGTGLCCGSVSSMTSNSNSTPVPVWQPGSQPLFAWGLPCPLSNHWGLIPREPCAKVGGVAADEKGWRKKRVSQGQKGRDPLKLCKDGG